MRKRLAVLLAGLLAVLASATALELKQGLMKLVIDESNARVSFYRLIDIAKGRYEPLFFDQDPRTSYATLNFEGKQYKLGDSAEYRFTISQVEGGARIDFRSASCLVTEELSFVNSADAALADGVLVTYTLQNVSQRDASIGLRLLIDSSLAEKTPSHFRTDLKPKIQDETVLDAKSADAWISTPGDKADLMVLFGGSGVTRPDQTIMANWKRLSDEPWSIDPSPGRSFTLLPYSVNDSAIAMFWTPAPVASGANRKLSIVIGSFNAKGYPLKPVLDQDTATLFAKTVLQTTAQDSSQALQSDLVIARDLISKIDQALASGKALTIDQVNAWRKILDALEERKKGY